MFFSDRKVLIVIIMMFVLVFVYAHYAMKPKQDVQIIQTSLENRFIN